jgi:hypothetical protein
MKRFIVAVILVAFAAAGCPREPEPPRNYVNADKHFRMNKPDGWDEVKDWTEATNITEMNLANSVDVAFISPAETSTAHNPSEESSPSDTNTAVRAVISVKTYTAPESGGGQALYEREKADLISKLAGDNMGVFRVQSEGDFITTNGKAHYVQCTWNTDNRISKKGLFVFVTAARRAAIVLCACKETDYSLFEEMFKKACESFYLNHVQQ